MKRVLIIGATSAIAEATARIFAERGAALHLLARNPERLETVAPRRSLRDFSMGVISTRRARRWRRPMKLWVSPTSC